MQEWQNLSGENAVNKTRKRIRVEVSVLETDVKIGENLSGSVTDTSSKECGAMTIHDVSALKVVNRVEGKYSWF